jgi:hypothetical protein
LGRGLGRVQQRIVYLLAGYPCDVQKIAERLYWKPAKRDGTPEVHETRAQIETVRLAVKALAKRKLIKRHEDISQKGNPLWITAKPVQTYSKLKRIKKAIKKRRLSIVEPTP